MTNISHNSIDIIKERKKFLYNENKSFIDFELWPSLRRLDLSFNLIANIDWVEFCVFFEQRNISLNITNNRINRIQWSRLDGRF